MGEGGSELLEETDLISGDGIICCYLEKKLSQDNL